MHGDDRSVKLDVAIDRARYTVSDSGMHEENTASVGREVTSLLASHLAAPSPGVQQKDRDSQLCVFHHTSMQPEWIESANNRKHADFTA
jgi:hypothetical protein